jgi:hypothetical protein
VKLYEESRALIVAGILPASLLQVTVDGGIGPNTKLSDAIYSGVLPSNFLIRWGAIGIGPSDSWGAVVKALSDAAAGGGKQAPQVGSTRVPQRAFGGSVWDIAQVTERGPEMFSSAGKNYLLTPDPGYVTPMVAAPSGGGSRQSGGGNTYQVSISIHANDLNTINRELRGVGLPPLEEIARQAAG